MEAEDNDSHGLYQEIASIQGRLEEMIAQNEDDPIFCASCKAAISCLQVAINKFNPPKRWEVEDR